VVRWTALLHAHPMLFTGMTARNTLQETFRSPATT
jgi:hypothetical protein